MVFHVVDFIVMFHDFRDLPRVFRETGGLINVCAHEQSPGRFTLFIGYTYIRLHDGIVHVFSNKPIFTHDNT